MTVFRPGEGEGKGKGAREGFGANRDIKRGKGVRRRHFSRGRIGARRPRHTELPYIRWGADLLKHLHRGLQAQIVSIPGQQRVAATQSHGGLAIHSGKVTPQHPSSRERGVPRASCPAPRGPARTRRPMSSQSWTPVVSHSWRIGPLRSMWLRRHCSMHLDMRRPYSAQTVV